MSETPSHKNTKTRGLKGSKTEIKIPGNRRLDAGTSDRAREVERSGNKKLIAKAIRRLNSQTNKKKELLVPTQNLDMAKSVAIKVAKRKILIQNLSRTQRRFVK